MKSRAEKLTRMVALMKLQLQLSEWQLAHLRQRQQDLQADEVWLVGALNEPRPPAGSSSESIARRLATTGLGVRTVQAEAEKQIDQVRSQSRRVKHLEQVARTALAGKLREADMRSLEEIVAVHPVAR